MIGLYTKNSLVETELRKLLLRYVYVILSQIHPLEIQFKEIVSNMGGCLDFAFSRKHLRYEKKSDGEGLPFIAFYQ
jgi:hypothetical protein